MPMLEIPVEAAGFADVAAFGMATWVIFFVLVTIIGVAVVATVASILLAPRKLRLWAREGLRRTLCG